MGKKRVHFAADPAAGILADFAKRQREPDAETDNGPTVVEDDAAAPGSDGAMREHEDQSAVAETTSRPARAGGLRAGGLRAGGLITRQRVAIAVTVAAVLAAAVWWRVRSGSVAGAAAKEARAAEALVAEGELARYEAETRRYEAERDRLRGEHRALMAERAQIAEVMKKLRGLSEQTNGEFRRLYAPQKESFDSEISSYEDEQSLETAFALKNELDDKKNALLQKNSRLGEQHAAAVGRMRAIEREIGEIERVYKASFDDAI